MSAAKCLWCGELVTIFRGVAVPGVGAFCSGRCRDLAQPKHCEACGDRILHPTSSDPSKGELCLGCEVEP